MDEISVKYAQAHMMVSYGKHYQTHTYPDKKTHTPLECYEFAWRYYKEFVQSVGGVRGWKLLSILPLVYYRIRIMLSISVSAKLQLYQKCFPYWERLAYWCLDSYKQREGVDKL